MYFRMTRAGFGKASIMALLMAVVALWASIAIAGVNEDFIEAASRGDLPEVKRLLAKGAEVNAKTEWGGYTALMRASRHGHPEVVQALLARRADVNAKDGAGGAA